MAELIKREGKQNPRYIVYERQGIRTALRLAQCMCSGRVSVQTMKVKELLNYPLE